MLRATSIKNTHKMAVDITRHLLTEDGKYTCVVCNFTSHGMRPLSRAIRRRNDFYVSERPVVPDDQNLKDIVIKDQTKFHEHFPGHLRFYSKGESIFTEGTLVCWDLDFPEMYKIKVQKYFDSHDDVLRHTMLPYDVANPSNSRCNGWKEINYEDEIKNKAGM